MNKFRFSYVARRLALLAGRPATFPVAVAAILLWALTGPVFGYSDTWQLVVNTATTIITFLMVFIIQNTQNRDTEAIQLKLDELIGRRRARITRCRPRAHRRREVRALPQELREARGHARAKLERGELDSDSPEVKDLRLGRGPSATAS